MKLPQTARRVVITGMSAISPLGSSWTDVRSALLHNRSGIPVSYTHLTLPTT